MISSLHYQIEDFKERITIKQWQKILLDKDEKITFRGIVRNLVVRNIGYGILEMYKEPIIEKEINGCR